MGELKRSLASDLKQIGWALFLVCLILAVFGHLFGKQIGFKDAFLVSLGVAVLVTVTFTAIYIVTALWAIIEKKIRER